MKKRKGEEKNLHELPSVDSFVLFFCSIVAVAFIYYNLTFFFFKVNYIDYLTIQLLLLEQFIFFLHHPPHFLTTLCYISSVRTSKTLDIVYTNSILENRHFLFTNVL